IGEYEYHRSTRLHSGKLPDCYPNVLPERTPALKKQALTDKQVKHMKPTAKRMEVKAGPPTGLYLVVQPTGAKSWALRYRWHGRPRKLPLSKPYPELGLAAAHAEAEAALARLRDGIDPSIDQAQELAIEALKQESVGKVAEEFLKRALKPKEKERRET